MSIDAICSDCGKRFATDARANGPICTQCHASAISEQPTTHADAIAEIQQARLRAIYAPEHGERPASDRNDRNPNGNPGCISATLFVALAFVALTIFIGFVCVASK